MSPQILRQVRRREYGEPVRRRIARNKLGNGRYIGQRRHPLRHGYAEGADPALAHMAQHIERGRKDHVDLPAIKCIEGLRRAAIGNMDHVDPGHDGERGAGQVIGGANATGAVVQASRG
jgi:hypothetical protein